MKEVSLSLTAARELLLAAQGIKAVEGRPSPPTQKQDCLTAIRRMGLLQIDTISVVARSPYLVLWSRVGDYEPRWLDELLAEGALFEYWSHAACFLPIEDFGIYRRRMLDYAGGDAFLNGRDAEQEAATQSVLGRIREKGAVRSADFERTDKRARAWFDWKPEKAALEHLFNAGVLMIARREGFQRVYDLRERVLPGWDDVHALAREEGRKALVLKAVRALGLARNVWLSPYFPDFLRSRTSARDIRATLEEASRTGEVFTVAVEGTPGPVYVHRDNRALLEQAAAGALRSTVTTLLSPFDPIVSDRARALSLFGFAYRIEIYTPAAHRRHGYFSLPILHRGGLVGRLDAKAHRREGLFEVRSLHLEEATPMTEALVHGLAGVLAPLARWHGTPEIVIRQSDPPLLCPALREALAERQPSTSAVH